MTQENGRTHRRTIFLRKLITGSSAVFLVVLFLYLTCTSFAAVAVSLPEKAPGPKVQPGRTIFMIHGMFAGGWVWENYRKYFEERGYRCITPTLRHHGTPLGAPPPPQLGTTGLLDYAGDLEKEIRRLDRLPVIMGHSMGGLIAQILASRGLARSLVLLAPAAPRGINPVSFTVLKSVWKNRTRFVFWDEPMRPTLEGAVYSTLHLLSEDEQKKVFQKFTYESGRAAWEIAFPYFDFGKASRVDESKVKCPVLVIAGSEDRLVPAKVSKKVAEKYGAAYKEYGNHAHWILGEPGWENIAKYIYEWMNLN